MKQYKYNLYDNEDRGKFEKVLQEAQDLILKNDDKEILIQLVEPTCNAEYINEWLEIAADLVPKAKIYGMTSHSSLREGTHTAKNTIANVMMFEKSSFKLFAYECSNRDSGDAGREFCRELNKIEDLKGVLLMSSAMKLNPQKFMDSIIDQYPDLPIFGAIAGSSDLYRDKSLVFWDKQVSEYAIVAVALYGKDLHIETTYSLGWKPFGKQFVATETDADGWLKTVDDMPAFDIYRNNLGVKNQDNFFENTSPFPLFFKKDNKVYTRVSLGCDNKKNMAFCSEIKEGEEFFLSYAKSEYLLEDSLKNANRLQKFQPEAILIYACNNRRALLGDFLAEHEFDYFRDILQSATNASGYGEILYSDESIGVLNSALVAVGIREGDRNDLIEREEIVDPYLTNSTGVLPMVDRLISFLENTTQDLRDALAKLHDLSSHDSLTGVYNRSALDFYYNKLQNSMGEEEKLGILMFDIDHFKNVNDTYGHDVGDAVLKRVVACIDENLTKKDILARWGGEEFIVLIKEDSIDNLFDIAEKIRNNIKHTAFNPVKNLTISVGVSQASKNESNVDSFKKVDRALYEAKNTGRDKTVVNL